ncbi:hypothetical protein Pmani_033226 [Petrolisthes manimaculis]|uniref:Uncharacterized protein n=1 Tax=Petrolisthes manimaculis TaxID=1843537 RepID=A0AAE1NRB9_9EUCA|nr:hypothetical protein Pmani_033226 [Petrolisthes manimaculis]
MIVKLVHIVIVVCYALVIDVNSTAFQISLKTLPSVVVVVVMVGVILGVAAGLPHSLTDHPSPYAYYYQNGDIGQNHRYHFDDEGSNGTKHILTNSSYQHYHEENDNDEDDGRLIENFDLHYDPYLSHDPQSDDDNNNHDEDNNNDKFYHNPRLDQQKYDPLQVASHNYDHSKYDTFHNHDDYNHQYNTLDTRGDVSDGYTSTTTTTDNILRNSLMVIYKDLYYRLGGNMQQLSDYLLRRMATEEEEYSPVNHIEEKPSARISANRGGGGGGYITHGYHHHNNNNNNNNHHYKNNKKHNYHGRSDLVCINMYTSHYNKGGNNMCVSVFNGLAVVVVIFLLQLTLSSALSSSCGVLEMMVIMECLIHPTTRPKREQNREKQEENREERNEEKQEQEQNREKQEWNREKQEWNKEEREQKREKQERNRQLLMTLYQNLVGSRSFQMGGGGERGGGGMMMKGRLLNLSWLTEGWRDWWLVGRVNGFLQGSLNRLGSLSLGLPHTTDYSSADGPRRTLCHVAGKLLH